MKISLKIGLFYFNLLMALAAYGNVPVLAGTKVVTVDERQLEVFVRRVEHAPYTVVFESGARNCIQRWEKVLQQLPNDVNVYAYNRPGYCNSSPSAKARNSKNVVDELRVALKQEGLKPPFILIGHSIGGLYVQHFAREFPEEVHGVVLVDAMYPGFMKSQAEFPWYTKLGMFMFLNKTVHGEISLAHASGLMIDALPAMDDKPVVRMFNEPKGAQGKAIAVDFGMFNRDEAAMSKVRSMYPRAKIVLADSSHQMQETSPDLIVQAIQDVMRATGPFQ